jgi:L-lactate dehydrogenase complex protein LldE
MKVSLFIPCFVDQLVPQVGIDLVTVLRRIGYDVDFPEAQTCCGQPAFNSGYWDDARPLAERFVQIFRSAEAVVCPSGSCTAMVRNFYPELLAESPMREEAVQLGSRVFEFSEFLVTFAKAGDASAEFPHRVAVHDSCHALRELHLKQAPREILRHVQGQTLVDLPYSEDCCGFGGTFSGKFPMISAAMGDAKAVSAEASGAEYVTSTDPSCLLHIDGILRRRNSQVRTISLPGILAQTARADERAAGARQSRSAR